MSAFASADIPEGACVACTVAVPGDCADSGSAPDHFFGASRKVPLCSVCTHVVARNVPATKYGSPLQVGLIEFLGNASPFQVQDIKKQCLSARRECLEWSLGIINNETRKKMDAFSSRYFMRERDFNNMLIVVRKQSAAWSRQGSNPENQKVVFDEVNAMFKALGTRCFMSSSQCICLLEIMANAGEFSEVWHCFAAYVIDKWNLSRLAFRSSVASLSNNTWSWICYYERDQDFLRAYRVSGYTGLLLSAGKTHMCSKHQRLSLFKLSMVVTRWDRLKRVARRLGWIAIRSRIWYNEHAFAPGHSEANLARDRFETSQTEMRSAKRQRICDERSSTEEAHEPHLLVHIIDAHTECLPKTICVPESRLPPLHRKYLPKEPAGALLMDASTAHEKKVWWKELGLDEEEEEGMESELVRKSLVQEFLLPSTQPLPSSIRWIVTRVRN